MDTGVNLHAAGIAAPKTLSTKADWAKVPMIVTCPKCRCVFTYDASTGVPHCPRTASHDVEVTKAA